MPVVLITGASHGIGAAIAEEFSRVPSTDLILVSRNVAKMQAVAEKCRGAASVLVKRCDVSDAGAVTRLAAEVGREIGVPDLLVNNAGSFKPGSVAETSVEDFRAEVDVNLNSAFIVTKAFLQPMVVRGSGMIVFMASVASIRAYPGGAAYCAAKHGLLGLARVVREETKATGVRVTTLIPGATWTPTWAGSGHAESRMMPASDIAAIVRNAWERSDRTVMEEIVVRPQLGDV